MCQYCYEGINEKNKDEHSCTVLTRRKISLKGIEDILNTGKWGPNNHYEYQNILDQYENQKCLVDNFCCEIDLEKINKCQNYILREIFVTKIGNINQRLNNITKALDQIKWFHTRLYDRQTEFVNLQKHKERLESKEKKNNKQYEIIRSAD